MDASIWLWAGVIGFIVVMLLIDLLIFQREAHEVSMSEAIKWSCFWVFCGLAFGGIIFLIGGSKPAGEYMAGYLIEKSLSIDNIFIFALILSYFAVPLKYHTCLRRLQTCVSNCSPAPCLFLDDVIS